jgi:hypothetical protein
MVRYPFASSRDTVLTTTVHILVRSYINLYSYIIRFSCNVLRDENKYYWTIQNKLQGHLARKAYHDNFVSYHIFCKNLKMFRGWQTRMLHAWTLISEGKGMARVSSLARETSCYSSHVNSIRTISAPWVGALTMHMRTMLLLNSILVSHINPFQITHVLRVFACN